MGEIQGILTLDGAAAHVIADYVTKDLAIGIENQAEFRLRGVPRRVRPYADRLLVADHPLRGRLEEHLRSPGEIYPVVHAGLGRFLHPAGAAPFVGDAGGPHLL
jgi:hypothetical protein